MKPSRFVISAAVAVLFLLLLTVHAQANWDLYRQYSTTNNPSHGWSYGFGPEPGGQFTLFDTCLPWPGDAYWWYGHPSIWYSSQYPIGYDLCAHLHNILEWTLNMPPGCVNMNPGTGNGYCVIRWTAPFAATYNIDALFPHKETCGVGGVPVGASDVYVFLNDTLLVQGIPLYADVLYTADHALSAGDTVEMWVGCSPGSTDWPKWDPGNNPCVCDQTFLRARIAPTPRIIYVKTNGDDMNSGTSWSDALARVTTALDVARSGDEIWVAAGSYRNRVDHPTLKDGVRLYGGFNGTETSLDQRDWKVNTTIYDSFGATFSVEPNAGPSTCIDGLTFAYGIRGIECGENSSPLICNNKILHNTSGGIFCLDGSSPTIIDNLISGNGCCEGVRCYSGSSPTIVRNTIAYHSNPAVLCHSGSSVVISNNLIIGNAWHRIVDCEMNVTAAITNNTIVNNFNFNSTFSAAIGTDSPVVIANNIIAFNRNGISGSVQPVLSNNLVYNPNGINYNGISAGPGDISADPLFISRGTGNYHLCFDSPCVDSGDNSYVQAGDTDLDKGPRIRPPGGAVDMGAYELDSSLAVPPDTFITSGPEEGSNTPSTVTFGWNGSDAGGLLPLTYSYRIDQGVWSAFLPSTTATITLLPDVDHIFAVRARNSAGAIDPTAASRTFHVIPTADLYVQKQASASAVSVGETITYDISVHNFGPEAASSVTVTDPLPPGVSFAYCSHPYNPVDGRISIGNMTAGQTVTVTLIVSVDQPEDITNSATVSADQVDPDPGNNTASAFSHLRRIYHVKSTGNDSNSGLSWSEPKKTVQAAVSGAQDEDQVWVAAGVYEENIVIGEGISLYGGFQGVDTEVNLSDRDWDTNPTILDGRQLGSVVWMYAGTRIDGFTIRNGSASFGGGIACGEALAITHNRIINNRATGPDYAWGGGIYCEFGWPLIANNLIAFNNADAGGGLYCFGASPIIRNNTIMNNTASYGGGAIYDAEWATPWMLNNVISGNSAYSIDGWDGWPYVDYCALKSGEYIYGDLGPNNIWSDPLLTADGELSPDSPCIDVGDNTYVVQGELDLACKPRICPEDGTVDMGAFEYGVGMTCDLAITGMTAPDTVFVGDQITYSVTVTNRGPDDAENAVVSDTLPTGTTYMSATASQGSCSHTGNAVTWNLPTLASGQSAVLTIVARAASRALVHNSASVSLPDEATDPDLSNNSASASTSVWAVITRINCGGPAKEAWTKDAGFSGGTPAFASLPISNTGGVPQAVYQYQRTGKFSYNLSKIANGNYVVKLYFSENQYTKVRQRQFDAQIEGKTLLSNFDIFAAAGARRAAVVKEFQVKVIGSNGLQLGFVPRKVSAAVAGIEVLQPPD